MAGILPNLIPIQLEKAPERFVAELRNALRESDCLVSTKIDIEFPRWKGGV